MGAQKFYECTPDRSTAPDANCPLVRSCLVRARTAGGRAQASVGAFQRGHQESGVPFGEPCGRRVGPRGRRLGDGLRGGQNHAYEDGARAGAREAGGRASPCGEFFFVCGIKRQIDLTQLRCVFCLFDRCVFFV